MLPQVDWSFNHPGLLILFFPVFLLGLRRYFFFLSLLPAPSPPITQTQTPALQFLLKQRSFS
jgi:hypothetical protein